MHTDPPENASPQQQELVRQGVRGAVIAGMAEIPTWLHHYDELDPASGAIYFSSPVSHIGDPASRIDGLAGRAIRQHLYSTFPGELHILGEEDDVTVTVTPGQALALVDPLDGTAPARHLFGMFGTICVLWVKSFEVGFRLVAIAIANSTGLVLTWLDRVVHIGLAHQVPALDEQVGSIRHGDLGAVAVVAAKKSGRERAIGILTSDLDVVYNVAGAPAAAALIRGDLGAIIGLSPQTQWDAAFLPMVLDTGGAVATAEGLVDRGELMTWFSTPTRDGKPVPPFVASGNADLALALAKEHLR